MKFITLILVVLFKCFINIEAGNILVFPMISRSQILSASRIASILSDDGHNVTIVIPSNDEKDIKKSSKYNILFYKTSLSREKEQSVFKEATKMTPTNMILGKVPLTFQQIAGQRCAGVLFDADFQRKLSDLAPDVAIVHVAMTCIIPHLNRIAVPFLDFCSLPLMHAMCGYPHRIPAPPSYVPDGMLSEEPNTFFGRVFNTMIYFVAPIIGPRLIYGLAHKEIYKYQDKHGLPHEGMTELRSKASFLLVHGDTTFETVRPLIPKVVYIGGVQCDHPKPLEGDLHTFVEESGDSGIIVFSLGGILNTESLPDSFIETFLDIFRELPHRVIWKLQSVPARVQNLVPNNVLIVDWMPQQDLLGHPKIKLFISHGGIQGTFESICHGVPTLGVNIFGDQYGNIKILMKKGMALVVDDYKTMKASDVKEKIHKLLSDPTFTKNAINARKLHEDQPHTPAQRLSFAVGYTIRHKGARHLTSDAALQLYWFQYYSLDVYLFLSVMSILLTFISYHLVKQCFKCCMFVIGKRKTKTE